MENRTTDGEFHIVTFFLNSKERSFILLYFFLIYLIGLMWNGAIILVVYIITTLHTPLYLFLSNLSFLDICYITVTVPKLMDILLSGNNAVTHLQCFTQLFFFTLFSTSEIALLTSMAYDRYMAICNPLHYSSVMTKEKCFLISNLVWIFGVLFASYMTALISTASWCGSKEIHQFFCDAKPFLQIVCNKLSLKISVLVTTIFIGVLPFLISLVSYIEIIKVILQITSKDGRKRMFSTCSSHFIVLLCFYGTGMCVYLNPLSQMSEELEQIFSLFYTTVTPVLNPLIYTLRNKEVRSAMARLINITKQLR